MKKNLSLWIFMLLCSSAWTAFYIFFFADNDFHLLSWASSFKDDTQPVLTKLKFSKSRRCKILYPSRTLNRIKKKVKDKNIQRRHREQSSRNQQTFSNHEVLLKRFSGDFRKDWCRIHKAKFDWNKYLAPCAKQTKWSIIKAGWRNKKLKTCAANSFISKWDIRPAGEFSRFFIQSKTLSNHSKNIGGDSWRIHVKGVSSVSVTVFDHNNGTYEVLFLSMEAGLYQIEIYLDYTLCDGFKDPPGDWYKKGSYQGKNQPDGILKGDQPYLMEPFGDRKCISIKVPEPKYSKNILIAMQKIRKKFFAPRHHDAQNTYCDTSCPSLISGGLGRWINGTWKPFSPDQNIKREPHVHDGVLWIYGDSVSNRFAENLVTGSYHKICETIFNECKVTYSWVYNIKNVESEENVDGKDYDHEKVMREVNEVLDDRELNENSVILLNWGIHFAAAVNFTNYKRLINNFLETVKVKRKTGQFKGKIIWRTTTAIFRERFPNPHKDVRRFLSVPRIILYNAYAMSAMCSAGVDVIDVYPMTDSFPPGTVSKRDPVHYERRAMESVQALLYHKFKPL